MSAPFGRPVNWADAGKKLASEPGRWRHCGTYHNRHTAVVVAGNIRHRRYPNLAKHGPFDAEARVVDGEHRVYARYVGVAGSGATPKDLGPGSTSPEPGPAHTAKFAEGYPHYGTGTRPEPGPPTCPDYPDCSEERLVRDFAASLRAGEPVGRWTTGCAACGTLTKGDLE